jgi:antirestriction protein ArdC
MMFGAGQNRLGSCLTLEDDHLDRKATAHRGPLCHLGAAFLCAELGISSEPRAGHAQYLDHWLGVMKADKKAIFTGASKASEAAAFLAALQGA